jgi:hypothetical protein
MPARAKTTAITITPVGACSEKENNNRISDLLDAPKGLIY